MTALKMHIGGCRELRATRMVVHSGFLPIMYFDEWHVKQSIEFWTEYMQDKPDYFNIYIENVFDPNPEPLVEIWNERLRQAP